MYKKPCVAASVAVFEKKSKSFLLILRRKSPFQNRYAFPGGFLIVGKEDLYDTAIRELFEETGISIQKFQLDLVDIRSEPRRDPRDHIIDVGFLAQVKEVLGAITESEETKPIWIKACEIDRLQFAFDHDIFWRHIKNRLKIRK